MAVNIEAYKQLMDELAAQNVILVAVSKTKPTEDILELYKLGHRDFGENYVQELADKVGKLPKDIRWHFIGHLQSNKVKYIAPFVQLIHGIDSFKLLKEVNKQGEKTGRVIQCLLQVYIAQEETKFGLDEKELVDILNTLSVNPLNNVHLVGLMGMASFTDDVNKIRSEFKDLETIYKKFSTNDFKFSILSMGMSADYKIAIEEGSKMVRIGSLIFGERTHYK